MTILIIFVSLVVVYTIACILDGPDFKDFWKHWMVSDKWRYAHYENKNGKRATAFHISMGRWKASEDPRIIKDKVYILPYICYYYNFSEMYVGVGWLVFEAYLFTLDYKKREKAMRRIAESR